MEELNFPGVGIDLLISLLLVGILCDIFEGFLFVRTLSGRPGQIIRGLNHVPEAVIVNFLCSDTSWECCQQSGQHFFLFLKVVAPCLLPLLCLAPGGTDVLSTQYCMLPIGSEVDDYAFLMFLKLYNTSNVFRVICGSNQAAFDIYCVLWCRF